ncbi:V-type ATP synthase subunit F [Methanogenium organophilum]|uniref:A-type ATP synthase subunit F n=1 Tax=Methanogenium organophilum TaxID=2199 RepID=A0A9X9S677_METOG|nr:V-type ATP synthase subunit F [Methanogenium organophilum]WAI02241.1 V-type ATP synthase subunit F [Methanogenium organophilum]
MEIAVVGNSDFILGFRLAGVEKTVAAEDDASFTDAVTRLMADETVAILVIRGSDMGRLPERLQAELGESVRPTVVSIGGEVGGVSMREKIKRAVGVDLWK